ncbi:YggT family protein [Lichenicoccus sp.]|uniref:YggT family protein n=1 Tax=Lichenicoccus sp. TaxID=2781899 RepID=UPI003D10DBEA
MLLANLFDLVILVIRLFSWVLILSCVFSMLFAFGVLDTRNRAVWTIGNFLNRVTDPVLAPVRRVMPNFGNIDLSPLVVLLLIQYVVIPLIVSLEYRVLAGGVGIAG